ncbi:hypothetical protein [Streptomyces griseorubiginosus]|uniref:hypothetical protein n=1 Tax=Streptomyces griseorubiginosus TaxID=67304 RepID=UPI003409E54C
MPVLKALDPLLKAPDHATLMSETLREFGYVECRLASQDVDPREEIRAALKGPRPVLVVHLVAPGFRSLGDGQRAQGGDLELVL